MLLKTRDFGEIKINDDDIIEFKAPIFGFEDYRRFVFLHEEALSEHLVWLQSTEEPGLCFILIDPDLAYKGYAPNLPENTRGILGEGDLMCWLIMVVKEDFERSTVNLRSPIVVNPAARTAAQVLLDEDYAIQHPIISRKEGD